MDDSVILLVTHLKHRDGQLKFFFFFLTVKWANENSKTNIII